MARRNRTAHADGFAENPAGSRLRARNLPHDTTVPAGHRSRTTSTRGRSRAPPSVPCPRADRPSDARHSRRARMSARIARTRGGRFARAPFVPLSLHPGSQLLGHDDTEILERSERSMELLQGLVGSRVAKCVNEELRVQDVLAGRLDHGSRSGDAISTPSMARVHRQLALKHGEVERALDGLGCGGRTERSLGRLQFRQRQAVRAGDPLLAAHDPLPLNAARHESSVFTLSKCVNTQEARQTERGQGCDFYTGRGGLLRRSRSSTMPAISYATPSGRVTSQRRRRTGRTSRNTPRN